jgi:hypothetical protein
MWKFIIIFKEKIINNYYIQNKINNLILQEK